MVAGNFILYTVYLLWAHLIFLDVNMGLKEQEEGALST